MGYTHFWTDGDAAEALPDPAVDLLQRLAAAAHAAGLIQRDHDDPRPPRVTARTVRFNGVGDAGHEAFHFDTRTVGGYGACKTARKPYDAVVMRVLLVLGHYRPGLEVRSDGAFEVEWAEALAWFNREVGLAYIERRLGFAHPRFTPTPPHPDVRF
jgi:hypothetical protein